MSEPYPKMIGVREHASTPVTAPGRAETGLPRPGPEAMLEELFGFLHGEGIPYCVVGATGALGAGADHDVDLVIRPEDMPRLHHIVNQFCVEQGARIVQDIRHEQSAHFLVLAWAGTTGTEFLKLDVCGDYFRDGQHLLLSRTLLEGRELAQDSGGRGVGFFVAAPAQEFIYYLVKKIDKGVLDTFQGDHLSSEWRRDPPGARKQLEALWPPRQVAVLAGAAEGNDWSLVRGMLTELRASLRSGLGFSMGSAWREVVRKVVRFSHPTGLWVAFLGPDGSGKSTVIGRLMAEGSPMFWGSSYVHLRPSLGSRSEGLEAEPVVDPHGLPPRSAVGSVAKLGYYVFDYVVGFWTKVRFPLVRSKVVVFDRYYHDLLVDPRRYRYGGPMWVARVCSALIPRPDVFFFLDASTEVLQDRKQEVSFDETARQRAAYLEQAKALPGSHVIDAAMPIDVVVAQVEDALVTHMAERLDHRWGGRGSAS